MFDIILYQPEIPPNTGNIIRLSANTGCRLHLVKPLGFTLEDKQLQRAGLDYHEYATVKTHENCEECLRQFSGRRVFALTTKGSTRYSEVAFQRDDVFVFGPETRGLPVRFWHSSMKAGVSACRCGGSRSLNLSNSVAVVVFEAWRQIGFEGGI